MNDEKRTISVWIARLGSLQPVPGAKERATGHRLLDEGETAAATLVTYGAAALPELIEATQSENWIVRYRAADVLGLLRSDAAVATLVALLYDKNLHVQSSAVDALDRVSPGTNETQNLRPGSAPVKPSMELLRSVSLSAAPDGSQEYARYTHRKVWLSTVSDMEMILIPAGAFLMGRKDQSDSPRRKVSLDAYLIAKNPTTVKQYMAFVKVTGHREPERPLLGWKDDHPIEDVSWEDTQAYCDWFSQQIGRTVALPTEAQWEKAARGIVGLKYPWGNAWNSSKCANSVRKNSRRSTVAVESYLSGASPYGVLDMAGNVWEWCSNWYDKDYPKYAPSHNPGGPEKGSARAHRGGSYNNNYYDIFRCANRGWDAPDMRGEALGFRCVASADSH